MGGSEGVGKRGEGGSGKERGGKRDEMSEKKGEGK